MHEWQKGSKIPYFKGLSEFYGRGLCIKDGTFIEKTLSTLIQWPVSFVSDLNWSQPRVSFESGLISAY